MQFGPREFSSTLGEFPVSPSPAHSSWHRASSPTANCGHVFPRVGPEILIFWFLWERLNVRFLNSEPSFNSKSFLSRAVVSSYRRRLQTSNVKKLSIGFLPFLRVRKKRTFNGHMANYRKINLFSIHVCITSRPTLNWKDQPGKMLLKSEALRLIPAPPSKDSLMDR